MFLISEVHPFDDGNGRVARAFMNAELVAAGHCRILIPSDAPELRGPLPALLRSFENHEVSGEAG
jgi:Fic family protein